MELRHLKYFVAVAEELSFRKAAERLNVSRPALSKQVKDLEVEMAVRLLERDTVSVSLTAAGRLFLNAAQEILAQATRAVHQAQEAQMGTRGTLRMGSPGTLATDFLASALKEFKQRSPGVDVLFVEMSPTEQLVALASGDLDIGFAYGKKVTGLAGLRGLAMMKSTYGVAVSKQHPLAMRQSVTLDELRSDQLLHLGHSAHGDTLLSMYRSEGIEPPSMQQVDCCDVLRTLIAAEQGISLLPALLNVTGQNVVIVPIEASSADLEFNMWAVWQGLRPAQHTQQFIRILEERAPQDRLPDLQKIS
jgi:LysR family transcriptional regulator, benzoate and cis,cis-muconate-responsive activator of ben and cat genes